MQTRIGSTLRALGLPLLLVLLAAAQLGIGTGVLAAPISWDHGAHLGKAMLTAQELFPFLRGWSDSVEAGVPLNTLYSVGGTAFVLLMRALTPFLSWPETYGLAVIAVRALVGLSVYRVARAAGGTRAAGFLGGVLALADHGDHSEGGWFYDIQFGVWPVSLAIAFLLFGLADVIEARESGRAGLLPRAAVCFAASLVSHQMPLLALAVLCPMFVAMRMVEHREALADDVRTLVATVGVGAMLSAFWLVPMLAQQHSMSHHGQLYRSWDELGSGAATGEFVLRGGAFTVVLAAVGMLRGLFSRGPRRYLAVVATVFIAISARDWLVGTPILRYVPMLGSIMYPRFLMLAKPLEFALAGMLLGDVLTGTWKDVRAELTSTRGKVAVAVAALLLAPFARGLVEGTRAAAITRDVAKTDNDPLFHDFLEYARWERSQRGGFYRVAYINNESHLFQGAPAFTGRPAHKIGTLIAEVFGNTTPSGSPEALAAMNVKRVVVVGFPPPHLLAITHRVAGFGRIGVYDVNAFDARVAIDPTGVGTPRVTRREREHVQVDVGGAQHVVVRRAFGPGWQARVDGRLIAIHPSRVPHAFPLRLMAIDIPSGGRVLELRYVAFGAADIIGIALTWLALGLLVLVAMPSERAARARIAVVNRMNDLGQRLAQASPSGRQLARVAALAAALGLAWIGWRVTHGRFDARGALPSAQARIVRADGSAIVCDGVRPNGQRGLQCPDAEWLYVGEVVQPVEGQLRSCIWAHPPGAGEYLEVELGDVELGATLELGAGVGDEAMGAEGATVELETWLDGHAVDTLPVPFQSEWLERRVAVRPGRHSLAFRVHASDAARRFLCFNATSRP